MSVTQTSINDQADAAHVAAVIDQWRDWERYLLAHQKMLLADQAAAGGSAHNFEQSSAAWEVQRAQGEADLRLIPSDRRRLFEGVRNSTRSDVQAQMEAEQRASSGTATLVPVDHVDLETIELLLRKAHGTDHPRGWGAVPMGLGPEDWYELDLAQVEGPPSAADYSVARTDGLSSGQRIGAVLGLLVVGALLIWLTLPASQPATAATSRKLTINGDEVLPWTVRQVELQDHAGASLLLDVAAIEAAAWPQDKGAPRAYWRSASVHPLELCVPDADQAAVIRLRGQDDVPDRSYTISETSPVRADLVLASCSEETQTLRYGVFQQVTSGPEQKLDQMTLVSANRSIQVHQPRTVGPEDDPTLPVGQVRIVVAVTAPGDVDWSKLAPILTLADGTPLLPGDQAATSAGVELRYLVAAFDVPTEASWQISGAGPGGMLRWRVTLDPPLARVETLRQHLETSEVTATLTARTTGQIVFRLRNTGSTPLLIKADDLQITQGAQSMALAALPELNSALAPGETRTVTMRVAPIDPAQEFVLTIGADRYSIRF